MEEKERIANVFPSSSSQTKSLFPIANYGGDSTEGRASLFPCAETVLPGKAKLSSEASNDWLCNASYKAPAEHEYGISETNSMQENEPSSLEVSHHKDTSDTDDDGDKQQKKYRKRYASDNDSSDGSVKRSQHKKKKKKHKSKHVKKDKKIQEKKHAKESKDKPNTIWVEESGLDLKDAYRIYCKPDLDNLSYGSLYRLDIALYKMKSRIACIGLSKKQSVKLTEKGKKEKRKEKEKHVRYWSNKVPQFGETTVVISNEKSTDFFKGDINNYSYVPLDLPSGKILNENETMKSVNEMEDTTTSNIGPKETFVSQRTAELNKQLRANPHDVPTWLELAQFQEEAVNRGESAATGFTESVNEGKKKTRMVITQKKIAVLEKALEQNPSSEELIKHHLELCSEIWDSEQLIQRWNKVVFTHPNKANLWREYLKFVQSRFSMFSFRKAQSAYLKCLSTLLAIKEGSFRSHKAEGDIEGDMLGLFVQYCLFMKQSGHMEKAIASFQAMIELNCFCPGNLSENTPTSGQIAFLETFWDSGQPRFGEPGAKGWKAWMDKSTTDSSSLADQLELTKIFKSTTTSTKDTEIESSNDEEEQLVQGLPKWLAWLNVELLRDQTQLKPWQPNREAAETEDDCEDPERLILFDDINTCLFKLYSPQNKLKLVLHLLEILGVPVRPAVASNGADSQRFFALSLEDQSQLIGQCGGEMTSKTWERYCYWYSHPVKTWPTAELLDLVRNVFAQSLAVFVGHAQDELMTTWLWYEYGVACSESSEKAKRQQLKEVHKLAKALLKQPGNRNNLALWQEFACLVWASGDVLEGRRIFDSTLAMACQTGEWMKTNKAMASLYRAYAELEVSASLLPSTSSSSASDPNHRAVHILVQFAEGSPYKPFNAACSDTSTGRILKAKRTYSQLCDKSSEALNATSPHLLPARDSSSRSRHLDIILCCALFAYVTQGMQAAADVFEVVLSQVRDNSQCDNVWLHQRELLWTSFLRLFRACMQKHIIHLRELRRVLHRALNEFPDNPEFLEFYLQVESKSNLTGEVRRFFDHGIQTSTSPVRWVYALRYEETRSKAVVSAMDCTSMGLSTVTDRQSPVAVTSLPLTGVTHRQRALLDRATSSSVGRQCVVLWRMYIDFEMKQGGKDKAKAVFYQAVHHCPWAKCLYLDAVKHFPDDAEDVIDMMHEKELRVRVPLEEIDILLQV